MVPAFHLRIEVAVRGGCSEAAGKAARMNRAAWHHGHFAAKSAPQHRDFAAGKVGTI